jgi:hypothetical protein
MVSVKEPFWMSLSGKWIGRGSPIAWPPRSLTLRHSIFSCSDAQRPLSTFHHCPLPSKASFSGGSLQWVLSTRFPPWSPFKVWPPGVPYKGSSPDAPLQGLPARRSNRGSSLQRVPSTGSIPVVSLQGVPFSGSSPGSSPPGVPSRDSPRGYHPGFPSSGSLRGGPLQEINSRETIQRVPSKGSHSGAPF